MPARPLLTPQYRRPWPVLLPDHNLAQGHVSSHHPGLQGAWPWPAPQLPSRPLVGCWRHSLQPLCESLQAHFCLAPAGLKPCFVLFLSVRPTLNPEAGPHPGQVVHGYARAHPKPLPSVGLLPPAAQGPPAPRPLAHGQLCPWPCSCCGLSCPDGSESRSPACLSSPRSPLEAACPRALLGPVPQVGFPMTVSQTLLSRRPGPRPEAVLLLFGPCPKACVQRSA